MHTYRLTHVKPGRQVEGLFGVLSYPLLRCAAVGFAVGVAFGMFTRQFLRLLRRFGGGEDSQIAWTFATAYICYYITDYLAGGSGKQMDAAG
jgi:NhaP-type Na+/H+ or K+/H+ antiporter